MALANLQGRVAWIFEDADFDIDQIIGIKNIKIQDQDRLAKLAMRDFDPDFAAKAQPGDLLVGNHNFGYGHPHYPPMIAMRRLGIAGVVAESFSPGYWRGEIAMGFPQVCCPGVLAAVRRWDRLEVDWAAGVVRNHSQGTQLPFEPLAEADRQMLAAGGLIGYLRARARAEGEIETTT